MFSKGRAGTAPCHREGHRLLCERWPTNDKAAKRRPVIDPVICHGRNLERAKGLEPSTPTLARSCSTTELHPHPRWRRTFAVNGRPMPNADRECNSPRAIRCHADDPIFINKWERIGPKQRLDGVFGPLSPSREPKVRPPTRHGAIRGIFEPASQHSLPIRPTPQSQSKVPWLTPTGHRRSPWVPAHPISYDPEDACRLNFVGKPPSSGGGTSPLAVLERPNSETSSQDIRRGYRDDS
jgi:hypothetical protein